MESGQVIKLFDLDFILQSKIGQGKFGEVWLVKSIFGNPLVIKKIMSNLKEDRSNYERFVKEASSLLDLDYHPHIVYCIGVEKKEKELMIIMEYIPGGNLRELITSNFELDIETKLSIAIQIAIGIEYLHKSKLLHRDIKPENILISKKMSNRSIKSIDAKIGDLGLLKEQGILSDNNMYLEDYNYKYQVGTKEYMSPEQALRIDDPVDENSDIFSYGVLMCELFTKTLPYDDQYDENDKFKYSLNKLVEEYGKNVSVIIDLIQNCIRYLPRDRWCKEKSEGSFNGFQTILNFLKKGYKEITGFEYVENSIGPNNFLFDKQDLHIAYSFKANSFYHLKNDEKALQYYNKSIDHKANNLVSFMGRGAVFTRQEKYGEALHEYDKAEGEDPYLDEIYYNKSITLDKCGRIYEALDEVRLALRLNPNHAKANYHKGMLLIKIGEIQSYFDNSIYEEAIDCFKKKLNSELQSIDTLLNIALCLEKMGRSSESLEYLYRIIDIEPKNTKALNNISSLLMKSEDFNESMKMINTALIHRPNDPVYHMMRGILFGKKRDYKKAIECFDKALRLNPNIPEIYHNKYTALMFQGKEKAALQCMNKYKEVSARQSLNEKCNNTRSLLY